MSELTLIVGNKNYSSWSLRPWLAMKMVGIPFHEIKVLLDQPDTAANIALHSPSGRVPALTDGDLRLWDSLAICEYLAEKFPEKALWPADRAQRARARSVSAEMHSGFQALRNELGMNLRLRKTMQWSRDAQGDIDRVQAIWSECRAVVPPNDGPFLFGRFSIADAMYAPVATRFRTYGVPLRASCEDYRDTILSLPAFREWEAEGLTEPPMARYEPAPAA